MLVLSRKLDESIQIGRDVVVRVVSVSGKAVRLGIDAPDSIRIRRTELSPVSATADGVSRPEARRP